ncbi:glycosyltransferase family 1 protein [Enterococcus dongliensis]|uniref:glycosyltransferase family 1 protein n=1 Tax=Enterococcus dongliensis TaxID=2559925 RepID=UPI0028907224|nr:glycosyltransferase family 1 protein [Enterococcus dongliensis]MDT2670808.1 glycosyltransferase family 1 protein [Enterococcus dongliensis]
MKRVLHFQGRMGLGGAESFMMNLYRKIDRDNFQFDFLIYDDFKNVQDYHNEIKKLGGRIFVVANPKKNILKYLFQVNRLLRQEKFDIAHNEVYFGGGINLWLAKRNGIKKRIAHSHATEDGKSKNLMMNVLRRFLSHLLLTNATDFLAVSQEAGQNLFEGHSFEIVHNGIDLNLYKKQTFEKEEKRIELGIPLEAFVIGNIGRLEKQKNQKYLLNIFASLIKQKKDSYLLLIGEGSLRLELEQKIRDLGIEKNVRMLGERNDIPDLLAIMDVFVMPSLYEGLPMVGLEAQAAGLKLVLADTISKDTKVTENVCFISLNKTYEQWVESIMQHPYINNITDELQSYDVSYTANQMSKIYNRNDKEL